MTASEVRALFFDHFGRSADIVAKAPGRVNLIGEHTDYNDGFVFPAAIDRGLYVAATKSDGESMLYSRQAKHGHSFDVAQVQPGTLKGWSRYPAGVAWALRQRGTEVSNVLAYVDSDIPMGSGVSSSAAIEMAFGVMWREMRHFTMPNSTLAQVGQVCENQFVGVNSGIMDQMASAMGREGMAMFLDTRSLEIEYAPIPEGISVVLCDTKKPRSLTQSAYNERRSQCEEASRMMGVPKLRDASMSDLLHCQPQMTDVVFRRARHVITENDRCVRFKEALQKSEYGEAGNLMRESHQSLQFDYEVSCPELDVMAEFANKAPGCIGARMTGAGFGGACVALVDSTSIDSFREFTLSGYTNATGMAGEIMACRVVDGAQVIES